tara:strand:- start:688 stop:1485 length:798 start_codon:yes stop_codon:yes gene_type:complete
MNISKETIKRLAIDAKSLITNPLNEENIYYKHDENNVLIGYAMIIGPENTPYSYGYYFFKFIFPYNYPFQPPEVIYLTNDGSTRFNPNLYTYANNGKVCLSILNTWNGEGWSSCQTIRSILLTLVTVLNETPLLNEPGINQPNKNIDLYNEFISYKNIEFSIIKQIEYLKDIENDITKDNTKDNQKIIYKIKESNNHFYTIYLFSDIIKFTFNSNYNNILNLIEDMDKKYKNKSTTLYVSTYNLTSLINTSSLKTNFTKINFSKN